jgi:lysophospholipase L1-like esterase
MRRRTILAASLAAPMLSAPPLAPPALARVPLAAEPIDRMSTRWWRERFHAKQAEIRRAPPELLMLGDSITQDYEQKGPPAWHDFVPVWEHFYGRRRAINLGFNGDATSHLLWRLLHGELDAMHPKAAVLLIGANNMGAPHWGAADTLQGIDVILRLCREKQRQMGIVLVSVLPSIRSAWISATTKEINAGLAARYGVGKMPGVTYVDVTGLFEHGGVVDATLFLDPLLTPPAPPLHPTAQTQARMAAAIEPALAAILGDRPRA